MLARRETAVGKCYVSDSEGLVREVLRVDRDRVTYNTYDLDGGKLHGAPQGVVRRQQMIHWADREATDEETAMLQRHELQALFKPDEATVETVDIDIARIAVEGGVAEAPHFRPVS